MAGFWAFYPVYYIQCVNNFFFVTYPSLKCCHYNFLFLIFIIYSFFRFIDREDEEDHKKKEKRKKGKESGEEEDKFYEMSEIWKLFPLEVNGGNFIL